MATYKIKNRFKLTLWRDSKAKVLRFPVEKAALVFLRMQGYEFEEKMLGEHCAPGLRVKTDSIVSSFVRSGAGKEMDGQAILEERKSTTIVVRDIDLL
jgi:hypothetical protein